MGSVVTNYRFTLFLGGLAGVNIFVTFLIQWYVLITIGPGTETDALFAAMALPQFVLAVVSGSLMRVLVPLLAGEDEEQSRHDAWGFFILIGAIFSGLAVLLYSFAPFLVPFLVPGFSDNGKSLTVQLTRIQLIGMVFPALSCVLWAASHARRRFLWTELTQLLGSILGLGVLVWALPRYGIAGAAWVGVIRAILQTLLLLPAQGGYCKPNLGCAALGKAWYRMKPLLFGSVYYKTGPLVDRFLSSLTPVGGLSLLYFGQQIYGSATQIMDRALVAPMVPLLAAHAKVGNPAIFQYIYRKQLWRVTCLTGGGCLLLLLTGEPLFRLLLDHGDITGESLRLLWWIMVALMGFFIGSTVGQILSSAFYAIGNTQTPTKVGVIGFTLGVLFKVVGFFRFGLLGIAMGTSLYYLLNVFALYILLEREHRDAVSR